MRKILDYFSSLLAKLEREDELNDDQMKAFEIFKVCVNDENNTLIKGVDISEKKYIVAKSYVTSHESTTFIVLQSDANMNILTIVNHMYEYNVSMPHRTSRIMAKMFNERLERDIQKMEEEIFSNTVKSLDIVLKQLSKEPELEVLKTSLGGKYQRVKFG